MSKPANLGPWSGGLDNIHPPHQLVDSDSRRGPGAFVVGINVDIDRDGWPATRASWVQADSVPSHSGRIHSRYFYGVVDGAFGLLDDAGFIALFPATSDVAYTVLNGRLVVSTGSNLYFVDGETFEGVPSTTDQVDDGKVLAPLPAGRYIAYWNGRLISSKGNSLFFSEPMWYGVYDTVRGILSFEERIKWLVPLETGIFVGLTNSVRFLAGSSPFDFLQRVVGGKSWEGVAAAVPTTDMSEELVGNANEVAVWLEENGFVIGLPDGSTKAPQGERLQSLPINKGYLSVNGDRLTVLPR